MRRLRGFAVGVSLLAGCGFSGSGPGTADDAGDDTTGGDGATPDAVGTGDGETAAVGCVPPGWRPTFRDSFDGPELVGWDADPNADGGALSWTVASGQLRGHSTSTGTDVAVASIDAADVAVVARMRVISASGPEFRVGGPILRAASIDFASNLFYACLLDTADEMLYLARYDVETAVSSGQGWTHLAEAGSGSPVDRMLTVTLCAQGSTITCNIVETGATLSAADTRYAQGRAGLRVMLADIEVNDFDVYQP